MSYVSQLNPNITLWKIYSEGAILVEDSKALHGKVTTLTFDGRLYCYFHRKENPGDQVIVRSYSTL